MIVRWIIRIIVFPLACVIVISRKVRRFFWGYVDKTVDEICEEFENPQSKEADVVDAISNSNYKTVGEIPSSAEIYAMTRTSMAYIGLMTQLMQNQIDAQKRTSELTDSLIKDVTLALKTKLKEKVNTKEYIIPNPSPRYDDIYFNGILDLEENDLVITVNGLDDKKPE